VIDVTVLADDLTGAADCGIAFALAGLPTFVSLGNAPAPDSAQIVSVDTDSRRLAEKEAVQRADEAARDALRRGSRALYKKIDSTLRGHVAAELAATVRAAAGKPLVLFAPAFPGTARIMRGGQVMVGGVPLEATEVWRKSGMAGPAAPVAMLQGTGLSAEAVPLQAIRSGLAAKLLEVADRGVQVAVCDAEEERDLRRIAEAGAAFPRPVIWVGSGGLARHLPPALGLRARAGSAASPRLLPGPVLALVGSRSTVAREQARVLGAEEGIATLELEPEALLAGPGNDAWARAAAGLSRVLDSGRDALLITPLGPKVDLEIGPALAAALARFALEPSRRVGGLLATGGDIARAVLGALGASGLHLVGEVETGVPIGIADRQPPLPVVTKAGAFGSAQTLLRGRAALKRLISAGAGGRTSTGAGRA